MLTQPHLLLNTPHAPTPPIPLTDSSTRNTALPRSSYTRSQEQNALRLTLDSSSRESRVCFFFLLSSRFFRLVGSLLLSLHITFASFRLSLSPLLTFFRYFHNRLSAGPLLLRRRRRRNVPIKSESHVLPISRQLNLVHAALAIAATRALCQDTPANFADRRTLDEYSTSSSFLSHRLSDRSLLIYNSVITYIISRKEIPLTHIQQYIRIHGYI